MFSCHLLSDCYETLMPNLVNIEIKGSRVKSVFPILELYGPQDLTETIQLTTCTVCIENVLDFVSCVIVWFDVKVKKTISTFLLLRPKLNI